MYVVCRECCSCESYSGKRAAARTHRDAVLGHRETSSSPSLAAHSRVDAVIVAAVTPRHDELSCLVVVATVSLVPAGSTTSHCTHALRHNIAKLLYVNSIRLLRWSSGCTQFKSVVLRTCDEKVAIKLQKSATFRRRPIRLRTEVVN